MSRIKRRVTGRVGNRTGSRAKNVVDAALDPIHQFILDNASFWWASQDITPSMQRWTDRVAGAELFLGSNDTVETSDPTVNTAVTPKRLENDGVDDDLDKVSDADIPFYGSSISATSSISLVYHGYPPTVYKSLAPFFAVASGTSTLLGIVAVGSSGSFRSAYSGGGYAFAGGGSLLSDHSQRVTIAMTLDAGVMYCRYSINGSTVVSYSVDVSTKPDIGTIDRVTILKNVYSVNRMDGWVADLLVFDGVSLSATQVQDMDTLLGAGSYP